MRRRTWSETDFELKGVQRLAGGEGGEGGFGGPAYARGEGASGSPGNAPAQLGGEGGEGTNTIHAGGEGGGEGDISDARLKDDIVSIGVTAHGLPLYRFRYKGADEVYAGVMAQDVLEVMPAAVSAGSDGFYRVNYAMLGIKMEQLS